MGFLTEVAAELTASLLEQAGVDIRKRFRKSDRSRALESCVFAGLAAAESLFPKEPSGSTSYYMSEFKTRLTSKEVSREFLFLLNPAIVKKEDTVELVAKLYSHFVSITQGYLPEQIPDLPPFDDIIHAIIDGFYDRATQQSPYQSEIQLNLLGGILRQGNQSVEQRNRMISLLEERRPYYSSSVEEYVNQEYSYQNIFHLPGVPVDQIAPSFNTLYVPQWLSEFVGEPRQYLPYDYQQQALLFIQDSAGSGKSTLLQRIVLDACEAYIKGASHMIPCLLHANELTPKPLQSLETHIIELIASGKNLDAAEISSKAKRGGLLIAIDGFDEVSQAQRNSIAKALQRSRLYNDGGSGRLILAGRPVFNTGLGRLHKVSLRPFTRDDAFSLVGRWRDHLLSTGTLAMHSKGHKVLQELRQYINDYQGSLPIGVGKPLYLTYLIILATSSNFEDDIFNIVDRPVRLYKRIVEVVIPDWEDLKSHNSPASPFSISLSSPDSRKILLASAFAIHDADIGETMSEDTLFKSLKQGEFTKKYLQDVSNELLDWTLEEWLHATVLVRDKRQHSISFWHLELQEYCAARFLVERFDCMSLAIPTSLEEKMLTPKWRGTRHWYHAIQSDLEHRCF